MTNNLNLSDMYIELNDTVPEQKHYVLYFLFEDEPKTDVYEYALDFESGMCIEDFREFVKLFGQIIQRTDPIKCEGE